MKRHLPFLLPIPIALTLFGFFLWGMSDYRGNPNELPSAVIEKPIPEFDFAGEELLQRSGFTSNDLRQGEVVVVNFFASWCVPCRAEHRLLSQLVEAGEIKLWGVNHRDKASDAKAFLDELGNPYERIGIDKGRGIIAWGAYGLPETYVIDGSGRIRYHYRGPLIRPVVEEELLPIVRALR